MRSILSASLDEKRRRPTAAAAGGDSYEKSAYAIHWALHVLLHAGGVRRRSVGPRVRRAAAATNRRNGLARAACPEVAGTPTCSALIESRSGASPAVAGWAPSDLQTAYNLPSSTKGSGQIVAIVDPYDDPNIASDLAAYRSEFGLGTANFTKYNQEGQTSNYPSGNEGWGDNKSTEVEMVSAVCPLCTIYLIEAKNNSARNFEKAEAEAAKLGAHIVMNGWSCPKSLTCVHRSYYDTRGVINVASSGTSGFDENGAPEAFGSVVSVGGTTLAKTSSGYRESFGTTLPPAVRITAAASQGFPSPRGSTIRIVRTVPTPTYRPSLRAWRFTIRTATAAG